MKKKMAAIEIISIFLLCSLFANSTLGVTINTNNATIAKSNVPSRGCAVIIGAGADLSGTTKALAQRANCFFEDKKYHTYPIFQPHTPFIALQTKQAITEWIPNDLADGEQIFFYFIGHGGSEGVIATLFSIILYSTLKEWFDTMEYKLKEKGKMYSCLVIVIEACKGGGALSYLEGKNRIVITSTDSDNDSWFDSKQRYVYFSSSFYDALDMDLSYGKAWEYADNIIDGSNSICPKPQNPKIYDDYGTVGTDLPDTLSPNNRLALHTYPITYNSRPNTPNIKGPDKGEAGIEYDYTFITTDVDGDEVYYKIDWGDEIYEDWFGPFDSATEVSRSHIFSERGNYQIRVKAKDTYNAESDWGTLAVTMPKSKVIQIPFLNVLEQYPILYRLLLRSLKL